MTLFAACTLDNEFLDLLADTRKRVLQPRADGDTGAFRLRGKSRGGSK